MSDDIDQMIDELVTPRPGGYRRRRKKVRKISVKRLPKMHLETANDDTHMFNSPQAIDIAADGSVVLGVYGAEDWIYSNIVKERYLAGKKTVQLDGTWLTNADFDLAVWVESNFEKYTFFGANSANCFTKDGGIVKVKYGRSKIEVEVYGDPIEAATWIGYFATHFRKAENMIEWVYNARGEEISVPLNYRPAIRAAYPWVDASYPVLTDYIDEYIDSDASVLILIGPPGTGKTTFIKNLIHRSKANAKVAYDPAVMMQDGFFAGFIGDETRFLIMEDADEFLKTRTEGNTMMHKFLNVSDGLISASDKKLVFSTNLPNVGDIDEALMRPGRCFDVLQFRELTRAEAKAVLAEVGVQRELPDGDKISLAEVFSAQPSGKTFTRRKIGFTS
jgi:molybdopterin-guanine dinucleotide biosynthesis protein